MYKLILYIYSYSYRLIIPHVECVEHKFDSYYMANYFWPEKQEQEMVVDAKISDGGLRCFTSFLIVQLAMMREYIQ